MAGLGAETLKDLVVAAQEHEGTVLDAADRSAPYSYREFATNCFKAGNLLGHYGVHPGSTVTVAVGPKKEPAEPEDDGAMNTMAGDAAMGYPDSADPLLAILGGASVGATVDLTLMTPVESRALVHPAWCVYEKTPRCSLLAYGGPPSEPAVAHFEAELWSENPTVPPEPVAADDPALLAAGETYTHRTLLAVADDIADSYGLDGTSRVALSAGLTEPGALVAGVLAPMVAGATVLLPGGPPQTDVPTATGDGTEEPALRVVTGHHDGREEESSAVVAGDVTASLRDTRRA
jgi:hypothetical protein